VKTGVESQELLYSEEVRETSREGEDAQQQQPDYDYLFLERRLTTHYLIPGGIFLSYLGRDIRGIRFKSFYAFIHPGGNEFP
jgi:hypothetical protein